MAASTGHSALPSLTERAMCRPRIVTSLPWIASSFRRIGARRLPVALMTALVLLLGTPAIALAHARLVRANPAPDALLTVSPTRLFLYFSENLNPAASKVIVWDRYRHVFNDGPSSVASTNSQEMVVPLKRLHAGTYLVLWTSVSAEDGHILRSSYLISFKKRGPGPSLAGVSTGTSQGFPTGSTLAALLAHWIELLSAVVWAGSMALFLLVLMPVIRQHPRAADSASRRTQRLVLTSMSALIVSSVVVLGSQAYDVGGGWTHLLDGTTIHAIFLAQYGRVWIARQALAVLAIVLTVLWATGPRGWRQILPAIVLIVSAAYLYGLAASGHMSASAILPAPAPYRNLVSASILSDWAHFIADALWLGGQVAIVLVLIPSIVTGREGAMTESFMRSLDRFSPLAYASIATYLLSGLFVAKVQIPSWYAYFNSIYGRALIVKMLLIALMMLVSVSTVYLLRPRLKRLMSEARQDESIAHLTSTRLLQMLRINPILGVGVLLATSVMFYYPVPIGFGPPGPSAYVVRTAGLTLTLRITPDRSGPNQIRVSLRGRNGAAVSQAHLVVLTTMLDMPMGSGLDTLNEPRPGEFAGSTDLGMGGHWRLEILIYRPSGLTRANVDVVVDA